MVIRPTTASDYHSIARIYKLGMDTGVATFETLVPDWSDWDNKYHKECRLVAEQGGVITGFAVLCPVSERKVYRGVAEVSVYVDPDHWYKGIGNLLLTELIRQSEADGFWTLQASIFPNNVNSIRLHKKCGFREVGVRERIGKRDGKWFDNILMERRSKITVIS